MEQETQRLLLKKGANKRELNNLIKLANNEIREWKNFIQLCKGKIKDMDKKAN